MKFTAFGPGLALALMASAASAQTITIQNKPGETSSRATGLRVQVQMQVTMPLTGSGLEDGVKQQELARRALYDAANRECRNLREVFGTDCRLSTLTVNTNAQDRRSSGQDTVSASASGSYELFEAPRP